jgi:site-specific recombinase XerC
VKQHLAALRMLFDWLVVGHALEVNPAHAVRGTKSGLRRARREGKILGRPRVAIDVEKVRKLQTQGLGLRGIAAETGWSLSSIVRALKAA